MLFNSMAFGVFLAVVFAGYALMPARFRWLLLLGASYFFYMSWNAKYAILILASTTVPYLCALAMARSDSRPRRRLLLSITLASNLGLLFAFKYANFAADSVRTGLRAFGVETSIPHLDVLLPVGISFYTFQTLSYAIDVYRGLAPERHFGHFALFVSFFPQLVAGPIERARNLLPQLRSPGPLDAERVLSGLQLILWGLFKKLVVADRCGLRVDMIYGSPERFSGPDFALAAYLFAFQIYCDFSGYSDIAIGSARLFGVNLMQNFRLPFFSKTMPEFWQRWHISLMTWLRDYVYLPLLFQRRNVAWAYFSMMVLMTASGIWHGAAWTFVLWGVLHGLLICASRLTLAWRDRAYASLGVPTPLVSAARTLITFHLFALSMVFFRAETVQDAIYLLTHLGTGWGAAVDFPLEALAPCAVLALIEFLDFRWGRELATDRWPGPLRWAAWYGLIFAILLLGVDQSTQFIYFQF